MEMIVLNTADEYVIASAMRGPDIQITATVQIKEEVVGRIRRIAMPKHIQSILLPFVWAEKPMTEEDLQKVETNLHVFILMDESSKKKIGSSEIIMGAIIHWLRHLIDAVHLCRNNKIWGGHGEQLHVLLRDTFLKLKQEDLTQGHFHQPQFWPQWIKPKGFYKMRRTPKGDVKCQNTSSKVRKSVRKLKKPQKLVIKTHKRSSIT